MPAEKTKFKPLQLPDEHEKKNDWDAFVSHVVENPMMYALAAVFIVLCALAGIFYRIHARSSDQDASTQYVKALDSEDPAVRAAELMPLTEKKTEVTPQALYMLGESELQSGNDDKAKEAFNRLRQEYPDYEFTPAAVEGIGFIAEKNEDYETAIQTYKDVTNKWADSFAARRQNLNIARCEEKRGNLQEAIQSYQAQIEVFPGSSVAADAQEALDKLKSAHPELFTEKESSTKPDATSESATESDAAGE